MAEKFYAVRKGTVTGIFSTWEECKASVHGYSGAEYKSFKTKAEAEHYLSGKTKPLEKGVRIYVDGSYYAETKEFSYGMVVLTENGEQTFSRKYQDEELVAMHNVAGEIMGARAAMEYALSHNIPEITIYHDYEGIAKWCLGDWKTNKEGTKAYKAFYDEISAKVSIHFQKVAGHSGDKYNDMADKLAKEALGIA